MAVQSFPTGEAKEAGGNLANSTAMLAILVEGQRQELYLLRQMLTQCNFIARQIGAWVVEAEEEN